ncbi:two-component system response regulator [Candidatus Epulonipiscium fishelsonii]|uniref:Two-component system response regulator n=1 Tax=Candidatus Epulonipiscium fishelsonii TaxID=77094 RepID=A0ACC8XFS6_9FIRM|nr:two-component system response regulator [Epulopiscium sp. SCG-B11WGA-EpuloA1]ONI42536.1 two-component system response regulator [Epulopiscium sp. SCG-B05WGA-EpuloA1]
MRILICEDEKQLANILVAILQHSNYSVDVVNDGVSALEYIKSDNYDGVILDIMMPKLDGISVLKQVRASGNKIPIIILSAKSQLNDKIQGLDYGANDYLTKPFEAGELLARIRVMTRKENQSSAVLTIGNITLNLTNFEISSSAGNLTLPNKEFQILEMLMRNKGQILSAEKFAERIWGYESDVDISTIWVYISNIRKKLASLDANVNIKAIRNIGYKMEEN